MKYTFEQKMAAVRQYLTKGSAEVPAYVTSKAKTFKIKVRRWALVYRMHGAEALRHGKTRHFTPDQKLAVRGGALTECRTAPSSGSAPI
jgi:hypothetical protein